MILPLACVVGSTAMLFRLQLAGIVILITARTIGTAASAIGAHHRSPLAGQASRVVIYGAGYKPRRFYPDNRTVASGFHWRVWSATRAVGAGSDENAFPGRCQLHHGSANDDVHTNTSDVRHGHFTRFRYAKWTVHGYLAQIAPDFCRW